MIERISGRFDHKVGENRGVETAKYGIAIGASACEVEVVIAYSGKVRDAAEIVAGAEYEAAKRAFYLKARMLRSGSLVTGLEPAVGRELEPGPDAKRRQVIELDGPSAKNSASQHSLINVHRGQGYSRRGIEDPGQARNRHEEQVDTQGRPK